MNVYQHVCTGAVMQLKESHKPKWVGLKMRRVTLNKSLMVVVKNLYELELCKHKDIRLLSVNHTRQFRKLYKHSEIRGSAGQRHVWVKECVLYKFYLNFSLMKD